MRVRLTVIAIIWVIIGACGAGGSGLQLVPAWQAAHGGGVSGRFTLTEPVGCDRYQPPRQRCEWFGDFGSDDGRTVRRGLQLAGGLPPGAQVGDTVAARDTGGLTQVYQAGDSRSWLLSARFFAGFCVAFLAGILLLQPWTWWNRRRR